MKLVSSLGLAVSLMTLGGCSHPEDDGIVAAEKMERIRADFNNGQCRSIYDSASIQFQHVGSDAWLKKCEDLRHRAGLWQSYKISDKRHLGSTLDALTVDAKAIFDRGPAEMRVSFYTAMGRVALLQLAVRL